MRLVTLLGGILGLVVLAGTAAAAPHAPIHIEGDADLCDDEDGDGLVGQDDGIVNCATADGSMAHPYVVAGWDIELDPGTEETRVASGRCPAAHAMAAVRICDISSSLVLRDMVIGVASGTARTAATGTVDPDGTAVGLVVSEAHVRIEDSIVSAGGLAIAVVGRMGADTSLEAADVDVRRPPEDAGSLGGPDDEAPTPNVSETAVVSIRDADVRLDNVTVDATGRFVGIVADASRHASVGQTHSFVLVDSVVQAAGSKGMELIGVQAEITGSTFTGNGGLGASAADGLSGVEASIPSYDIFVSGATLTAKRNHFATVGTSIALETSVAGIVQENTFVPHERAMMTPVAVQQAAGIGCPAPVHFNSLHGDMIVMNRDASCFVDARFNWWGEDGPHAMTGVPRSQARGDVLSEPWLRVPVERLPSVEVFVAEDGIMAHESVVLKGTASGPEPVQQVELSPDPFAWDEARMAEGTVEWMLAVDLGGSALGPRTFWVRACDEQECGVPRPIEIIVRGTSLAPVALLEADPMVVAPGDQVLLDASGSFSPQGKHITQYDFGDGWQTEPQAVVPARGLGPYAFSVRVRDESGLESTNDASLTIRSVETSSAQALAALPAVALAGVLAVAAAMRRT